MIANESKVTRTGVAHVKANKTDPEYQDFYVREWDGEFCEYFHRQQSKFFALPTAWVGKIKWDTTPRE